MADTDTLFEFPCVFPFKVIGDMQPDFVQSVVDAIMTVVPDFDSSTVTIRPSRDKRYLSITADILAQSKAQLDQLYLTVRAVPGVRVIL